MTEQPTSDSNKQKLRLQIQHHLLAKQRQEATELIAHEFLKNHYLFTIRGPDKSEYWIYEDGIYIPNGKSYIKEFTRDYLEIAFTSHLANEVILKLEADCFIEAENFFNHNYPDLLPVQNGILNIKTKELMAFDPKYIFFAKLPVTYNPRQECPAIISFFKDILKNEEDINVMQEVFGFLLLKEYKYEKAILLNGEGRNGKSKALELMKRLIGAENCSNIPIQTLESQQFSLSNLFGKMANICGDLSDKALDNNGVFKQATGRDTLHAPRKYLSPIQFVNYAKFVFSCNHVPHVTDYSPAFFRRWVYLEFPFTFVDQQEYDNAADKSMLKIRVENIIDDISDPEELSGLLNWSLKGLDRLQIQKEFSYSKTWEETKSTWLRKSSSFNGFLMDMIVEDDEEFIEKSRFRRIYHGYCKKHRLPPVGDKEIRDTLLTSLGSVEIRPYEDGNQVRAWSNIKIRI